MRPPAPLDYLAFFRAVEHGESLIEAAPDRVHTLIATHHLRAILDACGALIEMNGIACCDRPNHQRGWFGDDESAAFVECRNCERIWSGEDYARLTRPGAPFADWKTLPLAEEPAREAEAKP